MTGRERSSTAKKKGRNMILIPSNGDRHKSRSSCLAVAGRIKKQDRVGRGERGGGEDRRKRDGK